MNALKHIYLLLLVVIAAGCTNVAVQSDYAPNTDFSQYKTYAWMPSPGDSAHIAGDLTMKAGLTKSVNEELRARGYSLDAAEPDLLVVLHTMFETNTKVVREPVYSTYRYYRPGFYAGPFYDYYWPGYVTVNEIAGYNVRTVQYKEGSVVVDIIDRKTNHIVWRGWTETALKSDIQRNIDEVVSDMFDKNFPVRELPKQQHELSVRNE